MFSFNCGGLTLFESSDCALALFQLAQVAASFQKKLQNFLKQKWALAQLTTFT
jgi:hypothetical protein